MVLVIHIFTHNIVKLSGPWFVTLLSDYTNLRPTLSGALKSMFFPLLEFPNVQINTTVCVCVCVLQGPGSDEDSRQCASHLFSPHSHIPLNNHMYLRSSQRNVPLPLKLEYINKSRLHINSSCMCWTYTLHWLRCTPPQKHWAGFSVSQRWRWTEVYFSLSFFSFFFFKFTDTFLIRFTLETNTRALQNQTGVKSCERQRWPLVIINYLHREWQGYSYKIINVNKTARSCFSFRNKHIHVPFAEIQRRANRAATFFYTTLEEKGQNILDLTISS